MKKYLLSLIAIASLLSMNLMPVVAATGDSSGSSGNSTDDSSSSSGLEVETENGITFLKPHGVSGGDFFRANFGATEAMEIETEHGMTFLKPHGVSGGDVARSLGLNSQGMELETEHGVSFLKPHNAVRDMAMERNIAGRIVLQVQANGEAWWIDPVTKARVFLGRPDDAFRIMREHALGISEDNINRIAREDENRQSGALAKTLAGRIVLEVENHGEAWYIHPVTLKRHFLGRPADAFRVMRGLGLGITDDNINRVRFLVGKVGERHMTIALLGDNNSGQFGIAELKEVDGKVKVEVKLMGSPAGSIQPAHIHLGNRPNLGAVKYPLSNVVDGMSETILAISLDQLLSERPLGINVHKSAAEMSISVASGNL